MNAGLVTGLTITNSNSSPFVLMAGGSLMFNMGKSRVSLSGGICWGQVKTISSVATPYIWNSTKDPDNKVYQSLNDVPRFLRVHLMFQYMTHVITVGFLESPIISHHLI